MESVKRGGDKVSTIVLDALFFMPTFVDMPAAITLNFHEDVRRQVIKLLIGAGYSVNKEARLEDLVRQYLNYERRLIHPKPRRSFHSREFVRKFDTLKLEHQRVIREIERKSQVGESLSHFLSDKLAEIDFDDLLLNDWHIYHLHLGSIRPKKNGFVKRSKELLYAYVKPDALYLMDVLDHKAFGEQQLVEILHTNWPHAIERFKALEFTTRPLHFTSKEREALRNKGVQTLVTTSDGTTYWPFGGGYSSARLSTRVVVDTDEFFYNVRNWEIMCRDNAEQILEDIRKQTGKKLSELYLELIYTDSGWVII